MIFEAGLISFFRTILIIFIIFYGFKLLVRHVFPILFKNWVNKKMNQFQNQGQSQFNEQEQAAKFTKEHEGEVKIKSTSKHKTETEGMGDDVDYEEVD